VTHSSGSDLGRPMAQDRQSEEPYENEQGSEDDPAVLM